MENQRHKNILDEETDNVGLVNNGVTLVAIARYVWQYETEVLLFLATPRVKVRVSRVRVSYIGRVFLDASLDFHVTTLTLFLRLTLQTLAYLL